MPGIATKKIACGDLPQSQKTETVSPDILPGDDMTQLTIFGLKNCDTCRKALKWFHEAGIEATLHDFRKDGLDRAQISHWIEVLGADGLINKRGTTWRGLSEDIKSGLNEDAAVNLILENPALIKRPVVEIEGRVYVGFTPEMKAAVTG